MIARTENAWYFQLRSKCHWEYQVLVLIIDELEFQFL